MKMPYQYTDVVDGDFRLRCYTTESVELWISAIVARGHVPIVEAGPLL